MHISWLGSTAIKIQTKPLDEDIVVVIDPYKPEVGTFPRSMTPNIAIYTRGEENSITVSGNPFIMTTPGECETKGVLITCIQGHDMDSILVRLDSEQLSVGHLGKVKQALTNEQLDLLSGVDILLVPVGGGDSYDAEAAAKAVTAIEPRIVIPINQKSDNDPKSLGIETFLKEMGSSSSEPEKKLIIKKKDLPVEETKIVVLSKEL